MHERIVCVSLIWFCHALYILYKKATLDSGAGLRNGACVGS